MVKLIAKPMPVSIADMRSQLVVCASGNGSNFEAIVRASREGRLDADVRGLIVSRANAFAIERARDLGVPCATLAARDFADREAWDEAMVAQLREWRADWVVLAGYLSLIGPRTLHAFSGRIVNSHPALLPKFGGEGMYGDRVHAAVIKAGERETGLTVHTIDEEYDRGRILAQARVAVAPDDDARTLAERVKRREREFYPEVLQQLVTGRITIG